MVAAAATGDDSSLERVNAETVGLDILTVQSVGFAPQDSGGVPDSPGHCSPTTSFGAGRPRHGVLCWGWGAMSDFCFWTVSDPTITFLDPTPLSVLSPPLYVSVLLLFF